MLQLLFYAEQVERLQGAPVERVHVENGRGERESFRVAELHAYYRRVRERFLASLERDDETYPWPCGHCGICDFRHVCRAKLEADDHLVLVAGMRRGWAETLEADGVETLAQLGSLPTAGNGAPHGLRPESFEKVRHQAELQLRGRETGMHLYELLPDEVERGFRLLPEPDVGDVWLDLEGHPFYDTARGLEFLFGYCYRDETGEVRYEALWARDRDGERAVFERFVDWVVERRRRHPRLHVYHYAAYERTALTRLMGEHGTREREVDDFLRQEVLVDLYRIVRQSLRASTSSYSIKAIEALYGFEREAEVKGGDDAVVAFETWLETGDESLLAEVERYNEEDCRSTFELHEWLLSIRPSDRPWRAPARRAAAERGGDRARRGAGRAPRPAARGHGGRGAAAAARPPRRVPPARGATPVVGVVPLAAARRGRARRGSHGPRRASLGRGAAEGRGQEPRVPHVVPPAGAQDLGRGVRPGDAPAVPRTGRRRHRRRHRASRRRQGGRAAPDRLDARPPARRRRQARRADAVRAPVRRRGRRLSGAHRRARAARRPTCGSTSNPSALRSPSRRATSSCRGRPAPGRRGRAPGWRSRSCGRGSASASPRSATRRSTTSSVPCSTRPTGKGFAFAGAKRGEPESETGFESRCIVTSKRRAMSAPTRRSSSSRAPRGRSRARAVDIHAAERPLDVLFVDEAGQLALADVLAVGTAARSLVLLGDPNQLPQVSQGSHPEGSGLSVLEHLLGDHETVPPDRGLFLAETWRLRPELCAFTSDAYYEGRLDHAR